MKREAGFTLVEVMVALLVFGLIAAGGVALLSFSVRAQSGGGAKLGDIEALNRTAAVMAADCGQAVDRPTRDPGGAQLPAFTGEGDGASVPMLRLVRAGWSNLDAAPRPGLQKVEYRIENHALVRQAFPELDGAAPLPAAVLLAHVRAAALRYRYAGAWSGRWDGAVAPALPVGVPAAAAQPPPLPQALELTLVRDDGTTITQLFLVGTGYVPPRV